MTRENPATWSMEAVYNLFQLHPGQTIPADMHDEVDYFGCKVILRTAAEADRHRTKGPGRIVVECGCGKTMQYGKMRQHAKACEFADDTVRLQDEEKHHREVLVVPKPEQLWREVKRAGVGLGYDQITAFIEYCREAWFSLSDNVLQGAISITWPGNRQPAVWPFGVSPTARWLTFDHGAFRVRNWSYARVSGIEFRHANPKYSDPMYEDEQTIGNMNRVDEITSTNRWTPDYENKVWVFNETPPWKQETTVVQNPQPIPVQNPARRVDFVCEEHKEYGTNGWRAKNQPGYDPLSGMAVAHDCLEHFYDSTDAAHDEFMALGAALYVRGESGYFGMDGRRRNDPATNIGVEFPEIVRHVVQGEAAFDDNPPKTRPCEPHVEEWISQILKEGLKECKAFWEDDAEADNEEWRQIKHIITASRSWLRIGYRRAVKRFKKIGYHEACRLFRLIEADADKFLRTAELGDELHITVDISGHKAAVNYVPVYELYADEYSDE